MDFRLPGQPDDHKTAPIRTTMISTRRQRVQKSSGEMASIPRLFSGELVFPLGEDRAIQETNPVGASGRDREDHDHRPGDNSAKTLTNDSHETASIGQIVPTAGGIPQNQRPSVSSIWDCAERRSPDQLPIGAGRWHP